MEEVKKGNFVAEVQLLKQKTSFQIIRDADFEQGFYPAETTHISNGQILGPDGLGHGSNWEITGKVGDVFKVYFYRRKEKSLRWEYMRNEAVDWKEKTKSHAYCIAGSWNDFKNCQEFEKDKTTGNWTSKIRISSGGHDSFQILLNGNWLATLHPACNGTTFDGNDLQGPDDAGSGKYWSVGSQDGLVAGDEVNVHLDMDGPLPKRVWWERVNSHAGHHEYLRAGAERTMARHQRLMGVRSSGNQTGHISKVANAPEWVNGRRDAQQAWLFKQTDLQHFFVTPFNRPFDNDHW